MEAKKKIPITFITGNKNKLKEFLEIMGDELSSNFDITNVDIDCNLIYFNLFASG